MSHRYSRTAGALRNGRGRRVTCVAEGLESRQLLAAASFGTPISTALPGGFTPVSLMPTSGANNDVFINGYIVTGAAGGGLLLHGNNDGTFNTVQTLSTSATIIGFTENPNSGVPTIVTTSGLMVRQSNGAFPAPSGLTLPTDAVPGTSVWDSNAGQVIVERFHPNSGDPTKGSVILATFGLQQNGTFGSESDTTVLTNVAAPASNQPLWNGDFNADGAIDVIADNVYCTGVGDGTFVTGHAQGLSASELSAQGYAAPLASTFGSAASELFVYPAPATATDPNSDAVEAGFTGAGTTFTSNARVDLAGQNTTTGPLVLHDFTKDGTTDIAIAVTSGANSPAVSLTPGVGVGPFFNTILIPVPSLKAVAGMNPNNSAMLVFTATGPAGGPLTYSLATLPNNSTTGPTIQVTPTPATAFVNQPVVLNVQESISNSALPGTTMDFFDGPTRIGQATIGTDGIASFTANNLTAGVHTITAQDEAYGAPAASPAVNVSVNADPPHPLVSLTSFDAKLPTVITPGDKGILTINLGNVGASSGAAKLALKLYATANGVVDNNAIPIAIPSIAATTQNFAAKHGKTLNVPFNAPDTFPPGSYQLILTLDAATGSNSSYVIPGTVVHASPVTVLWQFGTVGDRKNVKFVQHLAGNKVVTFSLIGAGTGTITVGGGDLTLGSGSQDYNVAVTGTNSATKIAINQSGSSASNVVSLTMDGNVGSLDVTQDTPLLIGPAAAQPGLDQPTISVGKLSIGTMPVGQLAAGADPNTSTAAVVNINGSVGQLAATNIGNGAVKIGTVGNGGQIASAKIGTLSANGAIHSQNSIASLQLGVAQVGSTINAPNIGKLTTTGDFDANLNLTQPSAGAAVLGFVQIKGGIASPSLGAVRWAINGNIGKVQIGGAVKNFELLGGAKLGSAGELTTPPAAYSGTSIFSLSIRGAVTTSLFAAGLDPVDGVLLNSDDKLLPGGSIGSIAITGNVSSDSRFEAASLPDFAIVGGQKAATSGDQRFKST